jgi:hypothetical protein
VLNPDRVDGCFVEVYAARSSVRNGRKEPYVMASEDRIGGPAGDEDPTQGRRLGETPPEDPTQGGEGGEDPTQGRETGETMTEDPTQGGEGGEDPTQGRKLGETLPEDPTEPAP